MNVKNELTFADTDVAIEIISEKMAKVAKLYSINKDIKYKKILEKIKHLENELFLGNEKIIKVINTELIKIDEMLGENND